MSEVVGMATKQGVAAAAAARVTGNERRQDAVAADYLAWIDAKASSSAAMDALASVAGVSKSPARVLAAAELAYADLDDFPDPLSSLSATFARRSATKVTDLVAPVVVPHRGAGANVYPGGPIQAVRIGAEQGFAALDGGDLRLMRDGAFIDAHNTDLKDMTSGRGNVWNLSAQQASAPPLTLTNYPGLPGPLYLSSYAQRLREFGSSHVLVPEIKVDGTPPHAAGVQGAAMAALIADVGLEDSHIVSCTSLAELTPCHNAGIQTMLLATGDQSSAPAQAAAQAARNAGVEHFCFDVYTNTTSTVATYVAMGFKVWVYTINKHYDVAAWTAAGVFGYYSDDPVYASSASTPSRYRKTQTAWGSGYFGPGHIAADEGQTKRGTVANSRWTPSLVAATTLIGEIGPVANPSGTYTYTGGTCFDNLGSDASRHADVVVCAPDDRWFDAAVARAVNNGYVVGLRPSATNTLQIWEVVNGVTTSRANVNSTALVAPVTLTSALGTSAITSLAVSALPASVPSGTKFMLPTGQSVTTTALAAAGATSLSISSVTPTAAVANGTALPQWVPWTIQVTPTQVIFTRTDTGTSATATSSAVRGGYLHAGQNNNNGASGMQVSYTDIAVS